MLRFLAARGLQALASLWVAVTVVFVAVTQLPGDPVRALFGFRPPPRAIYTAIREQFHLDEPVWQQYLLYLGDLLRGDLGNSYPLDPYGEATVGPPVLDTLLAAAPVSLVLLLGAITVQVLVGVAAGTLSAARRRARLGGGVYLLALLLVSTPVLVAAYVLRTTVGDGLGWLPTAGVHSGTESYLLPVLALAALSTGYVILLTRSEVAETLAAPFVAAARSRGLPDSLVLRRHALRPALVPVVAFVAGNLGQLVVGLIVVEGVFDLPGLGRVIFEAIADFDRSLLVGLVTVVMAAVIVANAVADVLVAVVDPRIRPA